MEGGYGWQWGVQHEVEHEVEHLLERGEDAASVPLPRCREQPRVCVPRILETIALGPVRHGHAQVSKQRGEHGAWLGEAARCHLSSEHSHSR